MPPHYANALPMQNEQDNTRATLAPQYSLTLRGEEAMQRFATALAMHLQAGDCVLLSGTLGTGKTTLARGIIRALCGQDTQVVSPSFMLVQQYDAAEKFPLWHFDLYRLEEAEELWELGLDEALEQALVLVEWPEVAAGYWPPQRLEIQLSHAEADTDERRLQLAAQGSMVARLNTLFAEWDT